MSFAELTGGVKITQFDAGQYEIIFDETTTATTSSVERLIGTAFADTITGIDSSNLFFGQGGADSISGGSGADSLYGGDSNDTLDGGDGSDLLNGGNDQDSILGGSGNDTLFGAGGNDLLDGGDDDDIIAGGIGAYTMTGGLHFDRFLFKTAADANGDQINDFVIGDDTIDVSGIDADPNTPGDQEFTFIEETAFSGDPGELQAVIIELPGGAAITLIKGQIDGQGDPEFIITIPFAVALTEEDFNL
ncbi:hypothetical protein BH10PSE7_BH10PSE7_10390 [soil metagenome]